MKTCIGCRELLDITCFYVHPSMKDGHVNKCKDCVRAAVVKNREAKIDYYRDYDRQRSNLPKRVAIRAAYEKSPAGKVAVAAAKQRWAALNELKQRATYAVNNAVRDGRMQKLPCIHCGNEKVEGHHPDYDNVLGVVWLCTKAHSQLHKEHREYLRGGK